MESLPSGFSYDAASRLLTIHGVGSITLDEITNAIRAKNRKKRPATPPTSSPQNKRRSSDTTTTTTTNTNTTTNSTNISVSIDGTDIPDPFDSSSSDESESDVDPAEFGGYGLANSPAGAPHHDEPASSLEHALEHASDKETLALLKRLRPANCCPGCIVKADFLVEERMAKICGRYRCIFCRSCDRKFNAEHGDPELLFEKFTATFVFNDDAEMSQYCWLPEAVCNCDLSDAGCLYGKVVPELLFAAVYDKDLRERVWDRHATSDKRISTLEAWLQKFGSQLDRPNAWLLLQHITHFVDTRQILFPSLI